MVCHERICKWSSSRGRHYVIYRFSNILSTDMHLCSYLLLIHIKIFSRCYNKTKYKAICGCIVRIYCIDGCSNSKIANQIQLSKLSLIHILCKNFLVIIIIFFVITGCVIANKIRRIPILITSRSCHILGEVFCF